MEISQTSAVRQLINALDHTSSEPGRGLVNFIETHGDAAERIAAALPRVYSILQMACPEYRGSNQKVADLVRTADQTYRSGILAYNSGDVSGLQNICADLCEMLDKFRALTAGEALRYDVRCIEDRLAAIACLSEDELVLAGTRLGKAIKTTCRALVGLKGAPFDRTAERILSPMIDAARIKGYAR